MRAVSTVIDQPEDVDPVENVPLVEFMYLVFTRMPCESYRRRLRSLLYLCYVFRALINSLLCGFNSYLFSIKQKYDDDRLMFIIISVKQQPRTRQPKVFVFVFLIPSLTSMMELVKQNSTVSFHRSLIQFTHSLFRFLSRSFMHSPNLLIHSPIRPLSFIHFFTHSLSRSLVSFIHSRTQSLIHSPTHSPNQSFIHPLTRFFIHTLTQSKKPVRNQSKYLCLLLLKTNLLIIIGATC